MSFKDGAVPPPNSTAGKKLENIVSHNPFLRKMRAQSRGEKYSEISTDAPVEMGGKGRMFSSTDLVAAAMGTCMVTLMGIYAKNHDIPLAGTKVNIEKHMVDDPRRIGQIDVEINVPTVVDKKHRRALELTTEQCPVKRSLSSDVNVSVYVRYSDD